MRLPICDVHQGTCNLQVCAETKVGSHMIRGISGGQKKRLTTGGVLVQGRC